MHRSLAHQQAHSRCHAASSSPRATRGVAARAAAVPKTSKTANSSCSLTTSTSMTTSSPPLNNDSAFGRAAFAALAAAIFVLGSPVGPAMAVSGGGGELQEAAFQDLSGKNFSGKKFYKSILRGTIFDKANLEGANMFGSFCKGASFVGANLRNADLESVDFEGADLTDAVLEGAQMTNAQLDRVKSIKGSDWTDVVLRKDVNAALCKIAEGSNPSTGVSTRESLNCRG